MYVYTYIRTKTVYVDDIVINDGDEVITKVNTTTNFKGGRNMWRDGGGSGLYCFI